MNTVECFQQGSNRIGGSKMVKVYVRAIDFYCGSHYYEKEVPSRTSEILSVKKAGQIFYTYGSEWSPCEVHFPGDKVLDLLNGVWTTEEAMQLKHGTDNWLTLEQVKKIVDDEKALREACKKAHEEKIEAEMKKHKYQDEIDELVAEIRKRDGSGASDDIIVSPLDLQSWADTIEYHFKKMRDVLKLLQADFSEEDPEGGIHFTNELRLARVRQIKEALEGEI